MSYIVDISTSVPSYSIEADDVVRFFSKAFQSSPESQKIIRFLNNRTNIKQRYSCIPDFKGENYELYSEQHCLQPLEKRMEIYQKKILPLASDAVDKLFENNPGFKSEITHLITVSCTGMMAPGFELQLAEKYDLLHTEKTALNFLGCYAGIKAIKQARQITGADPCACVLIVCTELCSLHYHPSTDNEDIVANLLFGDGAAAMIICGNNNDLIKGRTILKVNETGCGFLKETSSLMSWNLSSTAFRMHLSSKVVDALKDNILTPVLKFINGTPIDHWAIHPGGIKIVEAVKETLNLSDENVSDSLYVLRNYGNMSSGTIFFVLQRILNKIQKNKSIGQNVFSCAFGPGLNIEMIKLQSVIVSNENPSKRGNDISKEIIPERTAG